MEKIYEPCNFPTTNKLTNLKEYFCTYDAMFQFASNETIGETETIDSLVYKELVVLLGAEVKPIELSTLVESCSIDNLFVSGEVPQKDVHVSSKYTMKLQRNYGITQDALNLETIKAKLKYDDCHPRKKEFANILLTHKFSQAREIEPGSEILMLVRVYHPFGGTFDKKLQSRYDRLKCSHEIHILGSQTLAELRDKILCANDIGYCVEVKELQSEIPLDNVKAKYPSGLISIDDYLYIDMRNSNAVDYSTVIKQWGQTKGIADFKTADMDQVCVEDLNFRLGYPYVYQHRGDCEHIIVFADVRMIKKSDPLGRRDYPHFRTINRYNAQHCNICSVSTTKWMCIDSDRLPHDRTFLCHECYTSYHYVGNERLGNFKTYPYYDKSLVY